MVVHGPHCIRVLGCGYKRGNIYLSPIVNSAKIPKYHQWLTGNTVLRLKKH